MKLWMIVAAAVFLTACQEFEASRPETAGDASGPAVFTEPPQHTVIFSDLSPDRPMGFRIDSEITVGQRQARTVVITLPAAFIFNGFDALGPAGTRIGAYGFEFNAGSAGPDRLFPVYSIDADSAWVDANLNGQFNALKPQIEYSQDGQQNHVLTITLPRGGDGSTNFSTAGFSSDIMAFLRSGIFTNPAGGQQAISVAFTSVDPDTGDADDSAGTPPEQFTVNDTVTIANSQLSASVLPNSRSVPFGSTATAFATIANGGQAAATNCGISLLNVIKGGFSYQTTDPNTNALTGTPNTPVTIPAGQSQSFLIAFTPVQEFFNGAIPFTAEPLEFRFACDGAQSGILPGVNTLGMASGTVAAPDVIAISATPSGDGTVYLGGVSGASAFALAGVNIGATGSITITPRSGMAAAAAPVSLSGPLALPAPDLGLEICETTGQANGACLAARASSLTVNFANNEVRTFSVFVRGQGQAIANNPAINRVFVDFMDSGGQARGGTSVAVTTSAPPT
ncbi:hypothetical protein [Hyphobacterium marinum]|uniref:Choice-of-anchor D domain-containing protein n=1 Tax=Hyphobacterium marinum TaxID=3116574 RepID=A0ABU7M0X2_9PROT|nr:hypothetical protein [Hyphobacterium sp. Y6023]MEE2567464.1 hypothetical protein [Hyphobacterium sp. Y6023]